MDYIQDAKFYVIDFKMALNKTKQSSDIRFLYPVYLIFRIAFCCIQTTEQIFTPAFSLIKLNTFFLNIAAGCFHQLSTAFIYLFCHYILSRLLQLIDSFFYSLLLYCFRRFLVYFLLLFRLILGYKNGLYAADRLDLMSSSMIIGLKEAIAENSFAGWCCWLKTSDVRCNFATGLDPKGIEFKWTGDRKILVIAIKELNLILANLQNS